MGYYSSFSYEIQEPVYVNPDKIKEIEKKCADENEIRVSDTEYRMLRHFLKGNFAEGIKEIRKYLREKACQLLTELAKRLEEGVYPLHIMYDDVFSYALEVKDGAHLVLIANDSLPAYDADPESVEDLAAVVDALESLRAKS